MQKIAEKVPKKCGKSSKKAQHRSKKVQQRGAAKGKKIQKTTYSVMPLHPSLQGLIIDSITNNFIYSN